MRKKLILPSLIALLAACGVSCNSKSSTDYEEYQSSEVLVSAFSLRNNAKILDSLSNVFFTIDLEGARIFNADSLPYGTKVRRLQPNITTSSYASKVQITYRVPETGRDSVINYLTNSTDSIDFSGGPVKLSVTSQNGLVTRDYEIRVNVHQVKSDSLAWYAMDSAPLPTSLHSPQAQRTVCLGGKYFCLTASGNEYCVAVTSDPADPAWTLESSDLPFTPVVESLSASTEALYMLSTDGRLYSSKDFIDWTDTGLHWSHIIGGYGAEILGVAESNGQYTAASYPSGRSMPLPAGMPVAGTTQLATYSVPMGYGLQAVMLGGRLPDGTLSADAWGYDGESWTRLCADALPYGMDDMTLVAYSLSEMRPTTWKPQSYPVLLAMGGRNASRGVNRTVYYSRDWGMTWNKAPQTVQLPSAITSFWGATAFCHTSVMRPSRLSTGWTGIPLRGLQPGWQWELPQAVSRATAPVSEWECPALYLFGGRNYDGAELCTLWRGVILQFTFEPVQ